MTNWRTAFAPLSPKRLVRHVAQDQQVVGPAVRIARVRFGEVVRELVDVHGPGFRIGGLLGQLRIALDEVQPQQHPAVAVQDRLDELVLAPRRVLNVQHLHPAGLHLDRALDLVADLRSVLQPDADLDVSLAFLALLRRHLDQPA